MTQVTTLSTYTSSNIDFPWHTENITDPAVSALYQTVLAYRWANYVGKKTVNRNYQELTFYEQFVWHDKSDYDTYKANPDVQAFEPMLAAYYAANGGSEVVTVTES